MEVRGLRLFVCATLGMAACSEQAQCPDAEPASVGDSASADAGAARRLRMATVNLRCLLDDWDVRGNLLAAQIAAARPQVIAVQEACRESAGRDNLVELASALASAGAVYTIVRTETHRSWDVYDEGIALLSLHPSELVEVIDLPPGIFPRRAIIARLSTGVGAALVAATHLSFGDDQGEVRLAQLATIRAALDRLREPTELVAVAGDFNEAPSGAGITATVAAGYIDSWAHIHPGTPGYTIPAAAPTARIDYVMASPGTSAVVVDDATIFLDQAEGDIMPSDHLGLHVDFVHP
jgi:endonuclease/exonuclease/phosphatase family metal-dependent hydrolase